MENNLNNKKSNNKYADLFKQALINLDKKGELVKIEKWVNSKEYDKEHWNDPYRIKDRKNRTELVTSDICFAGILNVYEKDEIPFNDFLNNIKSPDVFRSLLLEIYNLLNEQDKE